MGYDVCAIIGIRISDPTKTVQTVEHLRKIPEITECHFITGKYNILIKLYCTNNEHLMHTIFDHILYIFHTYGMVQLFALICDVVSYIGYIFI